MVMKFVKTILIACFILAGSILFAQTPDSRGYIVKTGQAAPEITLKLTDGRVITMQDLNGKIVMLQFTASWCGVCRKEMPYIEKDIWKVYQDKGLVLIGVDRAEPVEKVTAFAKLMNITYPLALDEDSGIFTKFADKAAGVTRNVLIDRTGKIVFLSRLYDTVEFEALKNKIAELISDH
jgi:peroxiredoxin